MQQIVMHKQDFLAGPSAILRMVSASAALADLTLAAVRRLNRLAGFSRDPLLLLPRPWPKNTAADPASRLYYEQALPAAAALDRTPSRSPWQVISNGRYITHIDARWLTEIVRDLEAPVIAVRADPELLAFREKVRLSSRGGLAGFRRWYADTAKEGPIPADWPPLLLIKNAVLPYLLAEGTLPLSFADLLSRCAAQSLTLRSIRMAGISLDLATETGYLAFIDRYFQTAWTDIQRRDLPPRPAGQAAIDPTLRIFGKVWIGPDVRIHPDVVLIGPTVIAEGAELDRAVTIQSSVVGPRLHIPEKLFLQNRVLTDASSLSSLPARPTSRNGGTCRPAWAWIPASRQDTFRTWSRFSYVRLWKPLFDKAAAVLTLVLFAPLIPFIALAIKLSSPGPVFFRHKRQGLHGKEFGCLKFRTMIQGADDLQRKLRTISQVDGPQFKIEDDPRVSRVGKFLRDTYLDEIPQFFHVLRGQMSLIGPRPSPVTENILCPPWHDARLSVRPGITGLWQICRTRQAGQDFQEWIHYDMKYVKNLSFRLDLWIFWQTTKKIIREFARQF